MMKPEHIPKEALGEMVRVLSDTGSYTKALAAAINAWPGALQAMREDENSNIYWYTCREHHADGVILPLPENTNDKA